MLFVNTSVLIFVKYSSLLSIILFKKLKLFDLNPNTKMLKILIPENLDYTNMFDDIFKKFVKE